MATLVCRIDSSVSGGSGVPADSMTSTPACWTSQWKAEPLVAAAASSTRRVASVSSGPVPSPGMSVTRWVVIAGGYLAGHRVLSGGQRQPQHHDRDGQAGVAEHVDQPAAHR